MAGGNVEIKFVADSSDLRAELGKVATSLDGVADATQGATNDMRKGLDGASKSAGDLAKKVPSVAGGAKTAGAALKGTGDSAADASDKLSHMEGAAGQASSSMSGLAGALSLVSPEAGAMAQAMADTAGGLEAAARGGTRVFAVLGPVALAVAAAGAAYVHFKGELDAANDALEAQRVKLEAVQDMHRKVKEAVLLAAVANGQMEQSEFDALSAAQSATDLTKVRRAALMEERDALNQQRTAIEDATAATAVYSAELAARADAEKDNLRMQAGTRKRQIEITHANKDTAEALGEVTRKTQLNTRQLEILTGVEDRYTAAVLASKTGVESKSAAVSKAAEVEAEINDGRLAALEQLAAIDEAKRMSMLEGGELLQAQADIELENIYAIQSAYLDDVQIRNAADSARANVLKNLDRKNRALEVKFEKQRESESKRFHEATKARIQQAQIVQMSANTDLAGSTAALFGAMSSAVGEHDKKTAMTLFGIWKGLSLAHVSLKSAEGIMTAQALPPPADVVKTAAVLAAAGAATITIASTKPPFHSGTGMVKAPDRTNEINARLRSGEAVSTPLGAETIGRGTIEAANAGVPIGAGSSPTVFMYEHRAFTRFIRDNVRGVSGGLADEINSGRAIGQRAIGR